MPNGHMAVTLREELLPERDRIGTWRNWLAAFIRAGGGWEGTPGS
jgi:hypothetical protein